MPTEPAGAETTGGQPRSPATATTRPPALIRLYHERWEHQTAYLSLRHTLLGGRILRSGDPAGLRQELWALLTACQLLCHAIVTAVEQAGRIDPDRPASPSRWPQPRTCWPTPATSSTTPPTSPARSARRSSPNQPRSAACASAPGRSNPHCPAITKPTPTALHALPRSTPSTPASHRPHETPLTAAPDP